MIIRQKGNRKHAPMRSGNVYSTASQIKSMHTNTRLTPLTTSSRQSVVSSSSLPGRMEIVGQIQIVKRSQTATEWVDGNRAKLHRYKGMYVAVTGTGIVAVSENFDDVYAKAKSKGITNPLVFKVPKPSMHNRVVSVKSL